MTDLEPILRRDLTSIATNWPTLLDLPHTPGGDKVDTTLASPTPLAISVLSLRVDAAYLLASWAHLVWDEQHLTTGLDLLNVVPITRFLTRHAGFLATHWARKDAVEEIGFYAGQIIEFTDQTKARRIRVGKCPDCEGNLVAYIHPFTELSDLRCSANAEHVWDQTRWRWVGDRIDREQIRCEIAARRLAAAILL